MPPWMIGDFQSRVIKRPATRDYCERPPAAGGRPIQKIGKLFAGTACLDYYGGGKQQLITVGRRIWITS